MCWGSMCWCRVFWNEICKLVVMGCDSEVCWWRVIVWGCDERWLYVRGLMTSGFTSKCVPVGWTTKPVSRGWMVGGWRRSSSPQPVGEPNSMMFPTLLVEGVLGCMWGW